MVLCLWKLKEMCSFVFSLLLILTVAGTELTLPVQVGRYPVYLADSCFQKGETESQKSVSDRQIGRYTPHTHHWVGDQLRVQVSTRYNLAVTSLNPISESQSRSKVAVTWPSVTGWKDSLSTQESLGSCCVAGITLHPGDLTKKGKNLEF